MYFKLLKELREDNDYTQSNIAEFLHINRSTYANWENGETLIPLAYLDQLTLFYNTSMSYILGLEDSYDKNNKIHKMDYDYMINNLIELKDKNNYTYKEIASEIGVSSSCCYKYHKKQLVIPIDKLINLTKFYNINIDTLLKK